MRPHLYSSERLNTRATHIQCCPGQPQGPWARTVKRFCKSQTCPYPSAMEAGKETRLLQRCGLNCDASFIVLQARELENRPPMKYAGQLIVNECRSLARDLSWWCSGRLMSSLSPVNYGCGTERQASGSTAGAKSWLTVQRSEVKQAGTRRSQASRAAHSLLV